MHGLIYCIHCLDLGVGLRRAKVRFLKPVQDMAVQRPSRFTKASPGQESFDLALADNLHVRRLILCENRNQLQISSLQLQFFALHISKSDLLNLIQC